MFYLVEFTTWAISSVVEHCIHIAGVAGSSPASPTVKMVEYDFLPVEESRLKVLFAVITEDPLEKLFSLSCSNRCMELKLDRIRQQAHPYVFDQQNPVGVKITGQTTALFIAAKRLVTEEVNREQKSYTFVFNTQYDSMKKWALTKGEEIFHWSHVIDELLEPFLALVEIKPQEISLKEAR